MTKKKKYFFSFTVLYMKVKNQTFGLTFRRRITQGFTPAIISLANSSSVIHADLLTAPSNNQNNFQNIYIR